MIPTSAPQETTTPFGALSRLFCAWQTLFISHQRWVNLLSTSREIASTGPWNQHSPHGSSWWMELISWLTIWKSIYTLNIRSPSTHQLPVAASAALGPCSGLIASKPGIGCDLGVVWRCAVGWIWVPEICFWIGFCWSNYQFVEVGLKGIIYECSWWESWHQADCHITKLISLYQFLVSQQDMVVNRTWLRHSQNFSFSSTVFHCGNV